LRRSPEEDGEEGREEGEEGEEGPIRAEHTSVLTNLSLIPPNTNMLRRERGRVERIIV